VGGEGEIGKIKGKRKWEKAPLLSCRGRKLSGRRETAVSRPRLSGVAGKRGKHIKSGEKGAEKKDNPVSATL